MQKTSLFSLIREEVIRGLVFAIVFVVGTTAGFVGVAYAASGGRFGELLNNILASGNWQTDTTGTVKNAEKLGGKTASELGLVTIGSQRTCTKNNQCVFGIDTNGNVMCR